jgi:hypothetical protein
MFQGERDELCQNGITIASPRCNLLKASSMNIPWQRMCLIPLMRSDMSQFYLISQIKTIRPSHRIVANPQIKKLQSINLPNHGAYFPDIIDFTAHLVYEVHWKGERKEEPFDNLPASWRGVNVFIVDFDVPETIVVKMPGFYFAGIKDDSYEKMIVRRG